jgi:hypothetical protein
MFAVAAATDISYKHIKVKITTGLVILVLAVAAVTSAESAAAIASEYVQKQQHR